jgi:hypothetical protein
MTVRTARRRKHSKSEVNAEEAEEAETKAPPAAPSTPTASAAEATAVPPSAEDEEPTATEQAIASARGHLDGYLAAMGAGSAEATGQNIQQKRKTIRAKLSGSSQRPSQPDDTVAAAAPEAARPTVAGAAAACSSSSSSVVHTRKQKRDLVTRYIVLIVCVALVILCLFGMSFLSWKTHGKWWGPLPHHAPLL